MDFFHIVAWSFSSFRTGWLSRLFPNTTWTSFIIEKTRFLSRNIGLAQVSGSPLKYFPFLLKGYLRGRNRWWPIYTTFWQFFRYKLSVSSRQWVQAWYPLFNCPDKLLSVGQSLMVTKNNAQRSKFSCLYLSHTGTPSLFHNNKSSSTNSLRYTSISLPGCFGPWISTGINIYFCFMQSQ